MTSWRAMYTLAKPRPVRTPTAIRLTSSRFRAVISLLRNHLRLEPLDGVQRCVVAAQVVAEELAALGLRELARQHRALVAKTVEAHAARDVPREPLVNGD